MTDLFDKCFDFLCELEGFSSNVDGDPGGRTIWGVSERYFPDDLNRMTALSPQEAREYAKEFYKKHFWVDLGDPKITAASFLMSVNAIAPAKKAIKEGRTWEGLLIAYLEYYVKLCQQNPGLFKFFKGWCNRIIRVWRFVSSTI